MKRFSLSLRCAFAAGLLGLMGCASGRQTSPASPAGRIPHAASACPAWRYIGVLPQAAFMGPVPPTCPRLGSWTGSFLFGADAPVELRAFCLYESPVLEPIPAPPVPNALVPRVDPDCAVLFPSGPSDDLAGMSWELLHERFLDQVGRAGITLSPPDQGLVRLSFIDSQPKGVGAPSVKDKGNSLHGYTLAHIGRELLSLKAPGPRGRSPLPPSCDGRDYQCAAQITTRLALTIESFDPMSGMRPTLNKTRGGSLGTISDLAKAIDDEVQFSETAMSSVGGASKTQIPLVLNLSVGWDGADGDLGGDPNGFTAPALAVYNALQRAAASKHVLVLAAAGNRRCPLGETGPLLPAAWEAMPVAADPSRPLLYAVGGIQADDMEIANARPASMPARVAYADHAVVTDLSGAPLPAMTGTSVSTAVVSSIAAAVWSQDPGLKPEEVMSFLVSGMPSRPLSYHADFPSSAPVVNRVLLCPALASFAKKTQGIPLRCPAISDRQFTEKLEQAIGPFAATIQGSNLTPGTGVSRWAAVCSADDWVRTQPEDNPCPTCTLTQESSSAALQLPTATKASSWLGKSLMAGGGGTSLAWTLRIQISSQWTGGCVLAKTLDVTAANQDPYQEQLNTQLCAGGSLQISNLAVTLAPPFTAAVTFTDLDGQRPYVSPLLVVY